jgi:DNA-binding Lrp family transcriptional regulator
MGQPVSTPMSTSSLPWWRIGRATLNYIADSIALGRGRGADILAPLISWGIVEANVALVNQDPELSRRYAALDTPPPDDLRRPVSVNALAASLRLPYETVRRRVAAMTEAGMCVSTPKGVYVPTSVLSGPGYDALALGRYQRLKRFYAELQALSALGGVNLAPASAPRHERPPVRAANRAISEYMLRVVDEMMLRWGDPLPSILLMEMTRANVEATDPRRLAMDAPVPDAFRTPITVLELARRVGLPPETVRRHVAKLEAAGFCRREKGGRLAALEQLGRGGGNRHSLADMHANVQRLMARCAALGVIGYWQAEKEAGAEAGVSMVPRQPSRG